MKSILIVAPYFFPDGGGMENYAYQVAKKLVTKNYKVTVLCMSKLKDSLEMIDKIKIVRKKCNFVISNTPIKLSLIFDIFKLIKKNNFDVIHAHTPVPFAVDMAALASKIKNIPLIITYHANTLFKGGKLTDLIAAPYLLIQYFTLKIAKKIITVSKKTDNSLNRWSNKINVIPPGVNLDKFQYSTYPDKTKNILLVSPLSRAYPSKGVNTLLQAVKMVKTHINDFKVYIAGDGDLKQQYIDYANNNDLSDNIVFLGKKPYSEIPNIFKNSNIIVIPSIKSEGTPTVISEAMASGRPIIGTTIGGIPDLIENGKNGVLINPNNPKELAENIINLLKDPDQSAKMGQQGRQLAEQKYSWKKISEQYEKIINNI